MSATKLLLANKSLHKIGARPITTFGETTTVEGRAINTCYSDTLDEILAEAPWTFAQRRIALTNITAPTLPTAWFTGIIYGVNAVVWQNSLSYTCLVAHTSGVFAVDLAAGDWVLTTNWVTVTSYTLNIYVVVLGVNYICLTPHTSGVFATDLASVYWGVANAVIPMTDDYMKVAYSLPTDIIKIHYISSSTATYKIENLLVAAVATPVLLSDTLELKIQYTYRNDAPALYYPKFTTAFECLLAYELCFEITEATRKAALLHDEYEDKLLKACASDAQQGTPVEAMQSDWENARLSGGYPYAVRPGQQIWHPYP
jgi:hypothetical protein